MGGWRESRRNLSWVSFSVLLTERCLGVHILSNAILEENRGMIPIQRNNNMYVVVIGLYDIIDKLWESRTSKEYNIESSKTQHQ